MIKTPLSVPQLSVAQVLELFKEVNEILAKLDIPVEKQDDEFSKLIKLNKKLYAELIKLLKKKLYAELMRRWWPKLEGQLIKKHNVTDIDHRHDILVKFFTELHDKIVDFDYRSESKLWSWLNQRLLWAKKKYYKQLLEKPMVKKTESSSKSDRSDDSFDQMKFKEVSLDSASEEDSTLLRQETIADDPIDADDMYHRKLIWDAAQELILNKKYLELLRCRLFGYPMDEQWSRAWIDTSWARMRNTLKILKDTMG